MSSYYSYDYKCISISRSRYLRTCNYEESIHLKLRVVLESTWEIRLISLWRCHTPDANTEDPLLPIYLSIESISSPKIRYSIDKLEWNLNFRTVVGATNQRWSQWSRVQRRARRCSTWGGSGSRDKLVLSARWLRWLCKLQVPQMNGRSESNNHNDDPLEM